MTNTIILGFPVKVLVTNKKSLIGFRFAALFPFTSPLHISSCFLSCHLTPIQIQIQMRTKFQRENSLQNSKEDEGKSAVKLQAEQIYNDINKLRISYIYT